MKNDLFTSIIVAILGVVVSFIVANVLTGEIKPVAVKTIDSSVSIDVAEPDNEVFNYRAINPTVEVYVGNSNCSQYDAEGNCITIENQGSPVEGENSPETEVDSSAESNSSESTDNSETNSSSSQEGN